MISDAMSAPPVRRVAHGPDVDDAVRRRLVGEMSKQEVYEAVREELPGVRFTAVETSIARLRRAGEVVAVIVGPERIRGQRYRLAGGGDESQS